MKITQVKIIRRRFRMNKQVNSDEAELNRLLELDEDEFESELGGPTPTSQTPIEDEFIEEEEDVVTDAVEPTEDVDDEPEVVEDVTEEVPEDKVPQEEVDDTVADEDTTTTSEETEEVEDVKTEVVEDKYIEITDDDDRKFKVKYMGEQIDLPASDIRKFTQIGIDAMNKDYKSAISTSKRMDELQISADDLEILAKLKQGDASALKNIMATSELNLEEVQKSVFDYDQEDLDKIKDEYKPVQTTDIDRIVSTVPKEVVQKYSQLASAFPGLKEFQENLYTNNDVANYENFLYNIENGIFDKLLPKASVEFASMSITEQQRVKRDPDSFAEFINPIIQSEYTSSEESVTNQGTQTETPSVKPRKDVVKSDISSKAKYSKPNGSPSVVKSNTKSEKQSVEELTEKYENMSDSEFNALVRSGKIK